MYIRPSATKRKNKLRPVWLALDWAGKYDDALAAGQQALSLDPNLLDAYAYLAEANADLNRTERALELAHKAIELDNNSWLAHRTLAYAYEHLGRYQNAVSEYQRAIELFPQFAIL